MTEWTTEPDNRIRWRLEPTYGLALEFEILDHQDGEMEIAGTVKWDGCCNWQTNPDCMAHFCQLSDLDELREFFNRVYALAAQHIKGWNG